MQLSPNQVAAAQALVALLSYQSGHAQTEALGYPDDVAAAIAAHGSDRINGAQAIKDELARLYDRRRDGHARQVEDEIAHQRKVLAARIVIEREVPCGPAESIEATRLMNEAELDEVAALPPNSRDQVLAVNERSARRVFDLHQEQALASAEAQQHAEEEAARVAADAEQKAVEEIVQTPTGDAAGPAKLPDDKAELPLE